MKDDVFEFGTPVREQVGRALTEYVAGHFESSAAAAKDLGISRQRLHSYMSGRSLPRADVLDLLARKWTLGLLGTRSAMGAGSRRTSSSFQMGLFRSPLVFHSEDVEVVVRKKGPALVAEIRILASANVA